MYLRIARSHVKQAVSKISWNGQAFLQLRKKPRLCSVCLTEPPHYYVMFTNTQKHDYSGIVIMVYHHTKFEVDLKLGFSVTVD